MIKAIKNRNKSQSANLTVVILSTFGMVFIGLWGLNTEYYGVFTEFSRSFTIFSLVYNNFFVSKKES